MPAPGSHDPAVPGRARLAGLDTFIARQPVLDERQHIWGYELLFRSGLSGAFDHANGTEATARVVADALTVHGLDGLTGRRRALVNITRAALLAGFPLLLPPRRVVIELLETVEPDAEVLDACADLKGRGYLLALDDFVDEPRFRPLLALADIVKVDVLATAPGEQRALVRRLAAPGRRFLAEKLETPDAFQATLDMGYRYFQGYFFCRPQTVTARDVGGARLHYLRLLAELARPATRLAELERLIKQDPALSYKLLRYINSAFVSPRRRIDSIRDALTMVGEDMIRRWASLMAMAILARGKPGVLVGQAVIRARFCELLAGPAHLGGQAESLFLMGMFSLLDAMMDQPMAAALETLPLPADLKAALLGTPGPLREFLDCVVAYETGQWGRFGELAARLGLADAEVPAIYAQAVQWGDGLAEIAGAGE